MDYEYHYEEEKFQEKPPMPNGMSSAALVLGIIAICTCCCFYASLPAAGLSILFALLSKGYEPAMSSRAKTGLILSVVAIIITVILTLSVTLTGTFQQTVKDYYKFYYQEQLTDKF